jgi:hypothetical protein
VVGCFSILNLALWARAEVSGTAGTVSQKLAKLNIQRSTSNIELWYAFGDQLYKSRLSAVAQAGRANESVKQSFNLLRCWTFNVECSMFGFMPDSTDEFFVLYIAAS